MRSLSDADLLHLWEGGLRSHPLDRAILALGAAFPETTYEQLADWPLGRRNKALLELRCACFGRHLQGWTACPNCAEKLEFELDGRVMALAGPSGDEGSRGGGRDESIVVAGRAFRVPSSRDLAEAARETDPRRAAIRIVENCCLAAPHCADQRRDRESATADGGELRWESWTEADLEEIGEQMALADPLAETRITLHCPKCEIDWKEPLEMVPFLWAEIEARARRLLAEVHTLATAYGWTETEILSLGENRRARYVEMVQS